MEERYSLIDHRASFKTKGMEDFSDKVEKYIDKTIDRNSSEVEVLKQVVSKYKGRKVQVVMAEGKSAERYNTYVAQIIDWNEEKSKNLPIYQKFLKSPFPSDYVPFAYKLNDSGEESLLLCEILDTPSPWIRTYNNDSSNGWAGHYFGNSIRNSGIVPYVMPDHYEGRLAHLIVEELEALVSEGNSEKIQAAGFENLDHVHYVIEMAKGNIQEGMAEAQALIDDLTEKQKEQMNANIEAVKEGGLLDPIKGVSMDDWAAANAKISNGMPLDQILQILGVEKPVWDEVSAEWMSRMTQDTTFAITTVYGNAFTNSNIGKFANAAGSVADAAGSEAVEKVKNDFEEYIKIMCHQNMASTQGLDATAVLKQYGLSLVDWSTVSAHWAPQMGSNLELAMKMSPLMDKYNAKFAEGAAPKVADDIEF